MPSPNLTDQQFIAAWNTHRSSPRMAKATGISVQCVTSRRRRIEKRYGMTLTTEDHYGRESTLGYKPALVVSRNEIKLYDGIALAFSDAHYWPGEPSTSHKALLKIAKRLKPRVVIANGDVFDGASISRHDKHGWEKLPSVMAELTAVKTRMSEVERAAPGAILLRTRGNHDARYERFLSMNVPEYRGVGGFSLTDHLPKWQESWSVLLNGNTMVKHRWHNGVHAAYNNVMKSGLNIVTGHLHALQSRPYTDYNGTRYGVDTGTLADPNGPQFEYAEDNPKNHREGFVVLTFKKGKLLPPELVEVVDGVAYFQGRAVK